MRRDFSSGFFIWISLREHVIINYVLSEKDLYVLTDFSVGGFKEIFCDKLYDIKDPSSYEALLDVGSTFGEFTLYMMIKGFRGEIITVEPLAFTVIPWRKHIHLQTAISSPEDFEKILGKSSGKRSIIKIDCEGCEKHLKPYHLQMIERGSILIIEAHDFNTYIYMRDLMEKHSEKIIRDIKTPHDVWILKSVI